MSISRPVKTPANRRSAESRLPEPDGEPVDFIRVIDDAYIKARRAQRALHAYIALACPGPHVAVQHRDRRPPWCHACGYTTTGVHMSVVERNG